MTRYVLCGLALLALVGSVQAQPAPLAVAWTGPATVTATWAAPGCVLAPHPFDARMPYREVACGAAGSVAIAVDTGVGGVRMGSVLLLVAPDGTPIAHATVPAPTLALPVTVR